MDEDIHYGAPDGAREDGRRRIPDREREPHAFRAPKMRRAGGSERSRVGCTNMTSLVRLSEPYHVHSDDRPFGPPWITGDP